MLIETGIFQWRMIGSFVEMEKRKTIVLALSPLPVLVSASVSGQVWNLFWTED